MTKLNELKKETLKSYIRKATDSHRALHKKVRASETKYSGDSPQDHPRAWKHYDKTFNKMTKRSQGIGRAHDRVSGAPGTLAFIQGTPKPARRLKTGHYVPYNQEEALLEFKHDIYKAGDTHLRTYINLVKMNGAKSKKEKEMLDYALGEHARRIMLKTFKSKNIQEETLDEVSKKLIDRYLQKTVEKEGMRSKRKLGKGYDLALRKKWGVGRKGGRVKIGATEETLDELSVPTLWGYREKAKASMRKAERRGRRNAVDAIVKGSDTNASKRDSSYKESDKRRAGIRLASKKLKEEQIDELSKKTLKSYIDKASSNPRSKVDHHKVTTTTKDPKAFKKSMNRLKGVDRASKKLKEDAPTNSMGASSSSRGPIQTYDPLLGSKKKKIIKRFKDIGNAKSS
jgi:hypothetical protein